MLHIGSSKYSELNCLINAIICMYFYTASSIRELRVSCGKGHFFGHFEVLRKASTVNGILLAISEYEASPPHLLPNHRINPPNLHRDSRK